MMESYHRAQRLISLMDEHPTLTRSEMNEMIGIQMHHREQIHAALLRLEQEQALQADFILRVQNAMKDPTWNRYSYGDIFTECLGFLFLGGMMLFYIYGTAMAKYRSLSTPHGRRQTWIQLLGVSSFGLFCAFWQDPLAQMIQIVICAVVVLYLAFDIHRYFYQQLAAQQRRRQRQAARRRRQEGHNNQQNPQQRRRRGRPCAKPYILDTLPVIQVTENDIKTHGQCPMCFEEFEVEDDNNRHNSSEVRRLPCSHLYHDECIEPWLLNQNCTCPVCAWEFPTDDSDFNRGQIERMKHRKPRYYRYELERTTVRDLKQWLPKGDNFQAIEKADLFEHLRNIGAIEVVDNSTIDTKCEDENSEEVDANQ